MTAQQWPVIYLATQLEPQQVVLAADVEKHMAYHI
jgi:hypothetical protein